MDSKEILDFIYRKRDSKPKLGLERIKKLLEYLDNPQDKLKIIHIAGTNGKGSTTTMIANILKLSGYKVGKFISPFIVDFCERIQINDEYIKNEEIKRIIENIKDIINKMEQEGDAPSSFEIITAIAFVYYFENNCDYVCLEVGMGGRFDATNVVKNTLVSVITLIDYDHMNFLGNTLEEISFEKCGIIKENSNVISYPLQNNSSKIMIEAMCKIRNCKLVIPNIYNLKILSDNKGAFKYSFIYNDIKYDLSLVGKYQIYNALTAIECANVLNKIGIKIDVKNIVQGINTAMIPARLEILKTNPLIIIDGSHNISGATTVKNFIENQNIKHSIGIIGMIKGKQHESFLKIVAPLFERIIVVPVFKSGGYTKEVDEHINIFNIVKKFNTNVNICENYEDAYKLAKSYKEIKCIFVTGSLYLASEFRSLLLD